MLEFNFPTPDEVHGEEAQEAVSVARAAVEYRKLYEHLDEEYGVTAADVSVYEAVLEPGQWETVVIFLLEADDIDHFYGDVTVVLDDGEVRGAGGWVDIYDEDGLVRKTQTVDIIDGEVTTSEQEYEMPDPERLSYSEPVPPVTRRYLNEQ